MERFNLTMKELKDLVSNNFSNNSSNLNFISIDFCLAPMFLYIYRLNHVTTYRNKSRKVLYEISHLNNNTLTLNLHSFQYLHLLLYREYD